MSFVFLRLISCDVLPAQSLVDDWLHTWLRKVDEARASQPHFVAPIVTTHCVLDQQFRYDMSWRPDPVAGTTANYGLSRGLEIIPATRFEVALFPPSYLVHQRNLPDRFGDFAFETKFRAFSATEGQGDYFVGFFLGGSFPTGRVPNGLGHTICPPPSAPERASVRGPFRLRLAQTFQSPEQIYSADLSFSTPLLTIGSKTNCRLCSSRTLHFGPAVRWTEENKYF